GIEEHFKTGRRVIVVRTFSKIYGLAGLRVGYGVAAAELVAELGKTRRAFDLTTPAQEAALASLDAADELQLRRDANAQGRAERGYAPAERSPATLNNTTSAWSASVGVRLRLATLFTFSASRRVMSSFSAPSATMSPPPFNSAHSAYGTASPTATPALIGVE